MFRFTRLSVLLILPALSVPAAAQDAMTRQVAERVGLTPAQARLLFGRLNEFQGEIDELSRSNRIHSRTLRAIALELGARNPNLSRERFVELIRARAGDAARTQGQIDGLKATIVALDPSGERSRAEALLAQARAAFDEGRLEDAEAAFGALSFLRSSELSQARTAWLAAVDLQAQSASLRGDTEGATAVRFAKVAELRRQREASEREEWLTTLAIADDWADRGDRLGDNEALVRSIDYYRELVLPLAPRARAPLQWATTQNNLGIALATLGGRESGTTRLGEAVTAYRLALEEWTRERAPFNWAMTLNNLGSALTRFGERGTGTARLEEAVTVYRQALEERTRERMPANWATTMSNLGVALEMIGERESGSARLEEAVRTYRQALEVHTRERAPLDWAMIQGNLATALVRLGDREAGTARLEEAVAAYRAVLEVRSRERAPLNWALTQNNLGSALLSLGTRESATARFEEAVAAFRYALEERTRARVPLDWAKTQNNLGIALVRLGERESGTARFEEAVTAFRLALEEQTREQVPYDWAGTQNNLAGALAKIGEREGNIARLKEAVTAYGLALEELTRERAPHDWAVTSLNLARLVAVLAVGQRDPVLLEAAERLVSDARVVALESGDAPALNLADQLLSQIERARGVVR